MKTFLYILGMSILFLGIYWFRVFPFREKKSKEPVRTSNAILTARHVKTGADRTGRSSGMGYNYLLTFRLENGEEVTVYAHDTQWGSLREGMKGRLTWQGRYYVSFDSVEQED